MLCWTRMVYESQQCTLYFCLSFFNLHFLKKSGIVSIALDRTNDRVKSYN